MARRRRRRKTEDTLALVGLGLILGLFLLRTALRFTEAYPEVALGAVATVIAVFLGARWLGRRHEAHAMRLLAARDRTLGGFLGLTPTEFELAVRQVLLEHSFRRLDHTGGAGDLSADLAGLDERGRSVVVQCKRYDPARAVGSPDVQSFIGMVGIHHGAERGVFVTTSSFTRDARDLGRRHGLTMIDGDGLVALARHHDPAPGIAANLGSLLALLAARLRR